MVHLAAVSVIAPVLLVLGLDSCLGQQVYTAKLLLLLIRQTETPVFPIKVAVHCSICTSSYL